MRHVILLLVAFVLCGSALGQPEAGPPKRWLEPGKEAGEEIIGRDGGTMVWVPAGSFMMGGAKADIAYAVSRLLADPKEFAHEQPVHRVEITKGFWLGKHEVTNAQYRKFCNVSARPFPKASDLSDEHPVVAVRWDEAKAYCDHYGLQLPTEAQWEYAARGPESRWYPWGNYWDRTKCCHTHNRGPGRKMLPAGSFPEGASWCGALDMAGNAREWCRDWYDSTYYAHSPRTDPEGPDSGEYPVMRGGAVGSVSYQCRSAWRNRSLPTARVAAFGFRVCVTP